MATPVWACGFECGVDSGSTGHVQFITGAGITFDADARTGAKSLQFAATGSAVQANLTTFASGTRFVGRLYIKFVTSLPNGDTRLIIAGPGSTPGPEVRFKSSDSKIYAAVAGTLGATGVTVTTNTWYRIDFDFNIQTGGNDVCDAKVNGTACGQATAAGLSAAQTVIRIGVLDDVTATVRFDDGLMSFTAADYPLGAGYVKSYIPNADGAHNVAGANDFEYSLTGTDITNASTDVYTLIDERPLPGTAVDFINGVAPPNSTDYVEWQYEDSTESVAPRAVEHIFVHHDAGGAGTNNFTITLREHAGGTSANTFSGTTNVGATITYKRAHYATVPGTATAWDTTKFNALRSRFLVTDASPDVYIDAAMLEAEFPSSDATPVSLAGNQPAASGAITKTYLIAKAGSQPASTGVLTKLQTLAISLAGNQPAASGVLSPKTFVVLAGNQPNATGALAERYNIALAGNQPASTGAVSEKYLIALAGNQPTATGGLQFVASIALSGNQPAASGALTQKYLAILSGNQPNATGSLSLVASIALSGNQPNATGALAVKYLISLAGNQPNATGTLGTKYLISLSGNQPSDSGDLQVTTGPTQVSLDGNQPNATGALSAQSVIGVSLAGDQPSASGALASLYKIVLAGNQPTATGSLALSAELALSGAQPASTGTLAQKYLISLAGNQPNATGTVSGQSIVAIDLAGNQPNATGSLTIYSPARLSGNQPTSTGAIQILYKISVSGNQTSGAQTGGNQPASTGTLNARSIVAISLAGNQPASTGTLAEKYLLQLAGNQPTATGSLSLVASIALAGNQPAGSGSLHLVAAIALSGNQPAGSGTLTGFFIVFVALDGNQPAASGSLVAVVFVSNFVSLFGNQPPATGTLFAGFVFVVGVDNCATLPELAEEQLPISSEFIEDPATAPVPSGFIDDAVVEPVPSGFISGTGNTLWEILNRTP